MSNISRNKRNAWPTIFTWLRKRNSGYLDLRYADLRGAVLRGAVLRGAVLAYADLRDAVLRYAVLRGAVLRYATMNWQAHELIAERLRQAAGDDPLKRMAAGYILVSRDWCWKELMSNAPDIALKDGTKLMEWTFNTMASWVRYGDDAPYQLIEYIGPVHKVERAA
jgi:hypothetical protein